MADTHHAESAIYRPQERIQKEARVKSMEQYRDMHKRSVEDPEAFWGEISKNFHWESQPKGKFLDFNFDVRRGPISIKWMDGATTNLCYNALDRHIVNGLGDKIAFYCIINQTNKNVAFIHTTLAQGIYGSHDAFDTLKQGVASQDFAEIQRNIVEGNDPTDEGKITFSELKDKVCQFANVLKSLDLQKGDKVAIYMPMIVEIVVAMLACARIGVIHSIVFGGFSAESLADRILDAKCEVVITADGVWRGAKLLNLKEIVDNALDKCKAVGHEVKHVIVYRHLLPSDEIVQLGNGDIDEPPAKRPTTNIKIQWRPVTDKWWNDLVKIASTHCDPVWLDAEDPLFMLYTSGSTGKPKGVLHTVGGYMMYISTTFKYVFDYQEDDIYWCTADVGWITGHSYVSYGPLVNGATGLIFEGVPTYPDAGRFWAIIDKYKVTKFYTAPTAIRALMRFGDEFVTKYNRDSLKVLGTVGEPINPEAWLWYYNVVGNKNCAIVDTFWQTETGGHVLTPLPGATPTKPGSCTFPFFGVVPVVLNEEGKEVEGEAEGYIVFKQPWPGIMRTVYGDHQRFETTYFKKFPGYYCTGDGGYRDKDGYLWITGRIDDMVNVSGHLLSTAEIESALVEHRAVTEAAVVSHPHPIKGECTYSFVTTKQGFEFTDELAAELKQSVRTKIGAFAVPDFIQDAPGLPKTRSGKIMRRVLRKIAVGDRNIGDVSTLADETVVDTLFSLRPKDA